ncbi:Glycoside hydrolase, family 76 [Metarhizium guizhouense ARSEF 977]|uniref:Glycoside hydrolase, family 76 n=1 Tax=Metarhizium guizhouense (strain ARSEF 977) TaxID=1276136 RepID=A0A0B4GM19_METGA|nr:Glycoside hydrolase, family 76 [Metarhizium guizhouense ARSEF 977]
MTYDMDRMPLRDLELAFTPNPLTPAFTLPGKVDLFLTAAALSQRTCASNKLQSQTLLFFGKHDTYIFLAQDTAPPLFWETFTFSHRGSFSMRHTLPFHTGISIAEQVAAHRFGMYATVATNGDSKWNPRVNKLVERGLHSFFPGNVAYDAACEKEKKCTAKIAFFMGLMHQSWTTSTQVAPFVFETVLPVLKNSTAAAVKQCTGEGEGEADGRLYRSSWARGASDGKTGAGGRC